MDLNSRMNHGEGVSVCASRNFIGRQPTSLRSTSFEVKATMAIWLGKQYLGQKEHPEEGESKGSVSVVLNFRDTSGKKGGESE